MTDKAPVPAKSKRDGFDIADLILKIVMPMAVVGASLWFNAQLEDRRELQACLDAQLSLIQFMCDDQDKGCVPSTGRSQQVPRIVSLVNKRCANLDDAIATAGVAQSTAIAENATALTGDADATAKVVDASGVKRPPPTALAGNQAPTLAPKAVAAPPSTDLNPRLYIQYKTEDQAAAAKAFQLSLAGSTLRGRPIIAPGTDFQPNSGVAKTELRCVTRADCLQAPDLAAYLGALLGTGPLPVRDVSKRYEGRSGTRPNHFEIWFGDGAIPRVSPPVQQKLAPDAAG